MIIINSKPRSRSRLRLKAGKIIYTFARYIYWYSGKIKFAREYTSLALPFCIFGQKTPLTRKLNNLDMWMQENKVINLRLAAKKLNGIILNPGETFSISEKCTIKEGRTQ